MQGPLIDISRPVTPQTATWPGDTPFSCGWTLKLERGDSVNLSRIETSPHVGTHIDAFLHYLDGAAGIGDEPIDLFWGRAVVVEVPEGTDLVQPDHLRGVDLERAERVLLRTQRHVDPTEFPREFTALAPETARRMVEAGVRLVGLDSPSVDPFDSKTLDAHRILGRGGAANIENLDLTGVAPGTYELAALPLRWPGLDASPVRAVLRPLGDSTQTLSSETT